MPIVPIIFLANSEKPGGRCVAGLRVDGGGWLRPIRRGKIGALLPRQYVLNDGLEAGLLDHLAIEISEPCPASHQPENWLLGSARWKRLEQLSSSKIRSVLAPHFVQGPELLGNTSDRVSYNTLSKVPARASLALVAPERLRWHIKDNLKPRAVFDLSGTTYDLAITDPIWKQRLSHLPAGEHSRPSAGLTSKDSVLLTISLGDPLTFVHYKLVAAVIVVPHWWRLPAAS